MPNKIKYSATAAPNTLRSGNVLIGMNDVEYGPTSATNFWNGIDPPNGGYCIYNPASNGSNVNIYRPANNAELVKIINEISSNTFTTAAEVLAWGAAQTSVVIVNRNYEDIVTDGLILALDAGFTPSYPTTGTTWYDLSGNTRNGTLTNGISFNSANSGSLVLDGADDEIAFTGVNFGALSAFTICGFVKPTLSGDPSGTIANNSNSNSPYGWHCRFISGSIGFWIGTAGSATHYDGIALTSNQWNFFTVTVNSTTITHYKNGVANNTYSGTFNTFVTNNAPFRMGRWEGGSYYYTGNIGNFCYYNRALSASEISQNFNAQKSRYGLI